MSNFQKVFIMVVSTVISLSIFEGVLQLIDYPNGEEQKKSERLIPDRLYHHVHRPDYSFVVRMDKKDDLRKINVEIDDEGFRDRPRQPEKDQVLIMGDSFVEARQVKLDEMFGNLIEDRLKSLDIVNVGVASWSSVLYYNWIRDRLRDKRFPHLKGVFLFFFVNDPYDTLTYLGQADNPEDFENITFNKLTSQEESKNLLMKKKITHWFYLNSKLYYLLHLAKSKFSQRLAQARNLSQKNHEIDDSDMVSLFAGIETEHQKRAINTEMRYITRIGKLLKQNNVRFTLVYVPFALQVGRDENGGGSRFYSSEIRDLAYSSSVQDILSDLAGKEEFNYIDLTPLMRKYRETHDNIHLYNYYDGHFSKAGHEVVAEILFPYFNSFN